MSFLLKFHLEKKERIDKVEKFKISANMKLILKRKLLKSDPTIACNQATIIPGVHLMFKIEDYIIEDYIETLKVLENLNNPDKNCLNNLPHRCDKSVWREDCV